MIKIIIFFPLLTYVPVIAIDSATAVPGQKPNKHFSFVAVWTCGNLQSNSLPKCASCDAAVSVSFFYLLISSLLCPGGHEKFNERSAVFTLVGWQTDEKVTRDSTFAEEQSAPLQK